MNGHVDKILKNHDINSDKTSNSKDKNTCKKQVCNQQRVSQLQSGKVKGA